MNGGAAQVGLSYTAEDAALFDSVRRGIFLYKADVALPDEFLAALRSRTDVDLGIDAQFLVQAVASFGLSAGTRLSRADSQGTFHRLYQVSGTDGPAKLLRVSACPGSYGLQQMALESWVIGALRQRGFPIPACDFRVVKRADEAWGVHLIEQASGVSLTSLDAEEPKMLQSLAYVSRFLSELHRVTGNGYGHLSLDAPLDFFKGVFPRWDDFVLVRLEEHLSLCQERGAITAAEAVEIAARFATSRALLRVRSSALLHGDPGNHNFMIDGKGVSAVIDWEDALLGDPLFDLASLCTFQPERRHSTIWSAYGADLAPANPAWTRFWLYFLRIALAKTAHRIRFAYRDHPERSPSSRRIQLAMARLEDAW